MARWFEGFGFKTFPPNAVGHGIVQYEAAWPIGEGQWPLFPSGVSIRALFLKTFSHGQVIYMYWGEDGRLRGARIGSHTFE